MRRRGGKKRKLQRDGKGIEWQKGRKKVGGQKKKEKCERCILALNFRGIRHEKWEQNYDF